MDAVLASVAMAAATGTISASTSFEEDCSYPEALSGEFQVAAYQALLASLLSPCCHRPPFLAQGLSIFRNGKCLLGSPKFMLFAFLLLCCFFVPRAHFTKINWDVPVTHVQKCGDFA